MRERHLAVQHLVFAHHAETAAECVPAPPESCRSATRWTRIGASISMRFGRQVHAVRGIGLDDIDAVQAGAGAAAAGDQLADDVAAAIGSLSAEGDDQQLAADAAGTRSGRIWRSAPIMQPVMRLMVEVRALTGAGSCGLTTCPPAGGA